MYSGIKDTIGSLQTSLATQQYVINDQLQNADFATPEQLHALQLDNQGKLDFLFLVAKPLR